MRDVVVLGVGMTRFGKYLNRSLRDIGREAVALALTDAAVPREQLEAAYVGNAVSGLVTGQECIRGQIVLRAAGIGDIPVVNVENACATSATAFHLGWLGVASGLYDCVLILGVEKMTHEDKRRAFVAIESATDLAAIAEMTRQGLLEPGAGESRSVFMDFYAGFTRAYMSRYGATQTHLAKISAKNHYNASLNPYAQYREPMSVEEILNDVPVVGPLTRAMCSPIADGAAAAVLCSTEFARRYTTQPVYVAASVLRSGKDLEPGEPGIVERASKVAYEVAGIGPEDVGVLEVHDATAAAELWLYEELGLCEPGEGPRLVDDRVTELRGLKPVNTSGGLECRGHPIGATGAAQIVELVWQLRGKAEARQVESRPRVVLAENSGGLIRDEAAAGCITILKR